MEAKELRIGNYVYKQWDKMVKQYAGQRTALHQVQNVNLQSAQQYDPIPLTEEWLLRFKQFEVSKYFSYQFTYEKGEPYSKGQMIVTLDFREKHMQISVNREDGENLGYIFLPLPEYVHTFQNWFVLLTSEELTIKETAEAN